MSMFLFLEGFKTTAFAFQFRGIDFASSSEIFDHQSE